MSKQQEFVSVARISSLIERANTVEHRAASLEDIAKSLRAEAATVRSLLRQAVDSPDLTMAVSVPQDANLNIWTDLESVATENLNRYVIQRGRYSYADVVWNEVSAPEFELSEAWNAIKDKIENKSERGRDSCRHSLKNDPRFTWLSDRPNGTWFRRSDSGNDTPPADGTAEGANTTP